MNIYAFPPLAFALEQGFQFLDWLSHLLAPLAGPGAAGLAVILLTLGVRALLIPVGASQVRGEIGRRKIAPRLTTLQQKYSKDPARLQQEMLALYKAESVSPFAGIGPALLQTPVLIVVYGLFVLPTIGGHPNFLLTQTFLAGRLGQSLVRLLSGGGTVVPSVFIFLAVLAVMAAVAEVSRRRMRSEVTAGGASAAAGSPGPGPAAGPLQSPALAQVLQWLPYIVLISAVFVPLAAALYLMTTTAWTAVERPLLRRRLGRTEPRNGTDSGFVPRPAG